MFSTRRLLIILIFYSLAKDVDCYNILESFDESGNAMKKISNESGKSTEIHRTMCKIRTEELVAEAEATFTRVLTGACNSKMIEDRFEKLEFSINERFDEIRDLVVRSLITKNDSNNLRRNYEETKLKKSFEKKNIFLTSPTGSSDNFHKENYKKRFISLRENEIKIYNDTIRVDEAGNEVYNYYWKVSNLYEKLLEWDTGRSERSSNFYVIDAGYAMYLRFAPKYFPDGTIFISAGLTGGYNDSKIIWPFPLKIRIEMLDLSTAGNDKAKDRSSRLWDPASVCSSYFWGRPREIKNNEFYDNPECVGLSIPRQLLTSSFPSSSSSDSTTGSYVFDDTILVKLNVYL